MYFLLLAFCLQTPWSETWKRQLGYFRLIKLLTTQTLKSEHWALCNCQEEGKAELSGGSTQTQSVRTNLTPVWLHKALSRRQTYSNLMFLCLAALQVTPEVLHCIHCTVHILSQCRFYSEVYFIFPFCNRVVNTGVQYHQWVIILTQAFCIGITPLSPTTKI